MYYSSIGILSILVFIIINFEALKKTPNTNENITKYRYRLFLCSVIIYFITDIFWGVLYENELILLAYITTVIYFISMVLTVFLWTRFVIAFLDNKGRFGNLLILGGRIILFFEIIVLIINLFIPIVFRFKNKVYVPGQARYVTLFIQMFLFLITSVYAMLISIKANGKVRANHRTIAFSGFIMTTLIALQSLFPLMPFYSVGCLLTSCMIHTFVNIDKTKEFKMEIKEKEKLAYIDSLTGVANKLAYLDAIKNIEIRTQDGTLTEYGVVVFDLNNLKLINDKYGHDVGDESLKQMANLISNHYKKCPLFRIGGDEFVVILEGEDYINRTVLCESFENIINENNKIGKLAIASGLSIYDPNNEENFNDVFKHADQKMYERKKLLKGF